MIDPSERDEKMIELIGDKFRYVNDKLAWADPEMRTFWMDMLYVMVKGIIRNTPYDEDPE